MKSLLFFVLLLGCAPQQESAPEQLRRAPKKMLADAPDIEFIHPLGCGQWIAKRGANQKWRIYPVCADLTRGPA